MEIHLNLNGKPLDAEVRADTLLLDFLLVYLTRHHHKIAI